MLRTQSGPRLDSLKYFVFNILTAEHRRNKITDLPLSLQFLPLWGFTLLCKFTESLLISSYNHAIQYSLALPQVLCVMQAGLEPAVFLAQPGDSEHLLGYGTCVPVAPGKPVCFTLTTLLCSPRLRLSCWCLGDLAVLLVYHSNDCGISVYVEMVLKYRRFFSGEKRTRKLSPRRVFITE